MAGRVVVTVNGMHRARMVEVPKEMPVEGLTTAAPETPSAPAGRASGQDAK